MINLVFAILLIFLPSSLLAQEKFNGIEFPYNWQKPSQNFLMVSNSVFTADSRLDYRAYGLEKEKIFRFVLISEIKHRKVMTILQWIDDNKKAHMFVLVKKKELFLFTRKKWVEKAWLPNNDYQRLYKLISLDLNLTEQKMKPVKITTKKLKSKEF